LRSSGYLVMAFFARNRFADAVLAAHKA
jgi:hypothetical protein